VSGILHDWFSWPNGSVLTNLVASGICVLFAAWRIFKKLNKIHEHVKLVHAHVTLIHDHQLAHSVAPKRKKTT
jgi:hypothetical protein